METLALETSERVIAAIREDPRVSLSDDDIIDAVCDAIHDGLDAQACLRTFSPVRDSLLS